MAICVSSLTFGGRSIFTRLLCFAWLWGGAELQKWMWGSSVFVPRAKQEHGTMAFSPPLHQAWLLQSLEEGLLLLVWVNNCLDEKEDEGMREKREGAQWASFPPQSKTSVRGIWSEDWRLFIWGSFLGGGGKGKMWGGTTETLLTNQKAEVKVLFLSHLGCSEPGDSSSSLQQETIFQNLQCEIFFCVCTCVREKKWCVCAYVHVCRHLCSH